MKQLQERIEAPFYNNNRFQTYFNNAKIAVFDIETTGLSPDYCRVILGGLLIPEETHFTVHQYFAESEMEERELLEACLFSLKEADVWITFNGARFDIPFLARRSAAAGIGSELDIPCSLDLYRCCKYYSSLSEFLPDLKQKTMEAYLGLSDVRTDEISGGESVKRYRAYCRTKNKDLEREILLHNRDDVVQLARLLRILDKLDLHRILFYEGFPVLKDERGFYVRSIQFQGRQLKVIAAARGCSQDYFSFDADDTEYRVAYRRDQNRLELEIPCMEKADCLFVDLEALPVDSEALQPLAGFQSGYLILRQEDRILYQETNLFIQAMLKGLLDKM